MFTDTVAPRRKSRRFEMLVTELLKRLFNHLPRKKSSSLALEDLPEGQLRDIGILKKPNPTEDTRPHIILGPM